MVKVVVVLIVCFGLGIIATKLYENMTGNLRFYFRNYHLHHSLFGVGFLIISVCMYLLSGNIMTVVPLIGFSIGNIAQHTRRKGFVFIEKDRELRSCKMFVIREVNHEE